MFSQKRQTAPPYTRVYGERRKNGRKLIFFACRKIFFAFCVAQNAKNVCDHPVFANWRRKKFEQSQKLFPSQISSKRGQMKSIKLTYDNTILEIYCFICRMILKPSILILMELSTAWKHKLNNLGTKN